MHSTMIGRAERGIPAGEMKRQLIEAWNAHLREERLANTPAEKNPDFRSNNGRNRVVKRMQAISRTEQRKQSAANLLKIMQRHNARCRAIGEDWACIKPDGLTSMAQARAEGRAGRR